MKTIRSIYLSGVICFFVLYGCENKKIEEKFFFDIPGYFKAEKDSIKSKFMYLQKTTVYNGDTSKQKLEVKDVNWDKEFALFLKTDINKPLYKANMQRLDWPVAQVEEGGGNKGGYSFLANKNTLDIQSVDIQTSESFSIIIRIQKLNLLSETTIIACYYEDSCYEISGEQHLKGFSNNKFSVIGRFE